MTDIKFCGLKTGRDVAAAEQAGARWTGYVIFERSPRHVGPALAGELAHLARNSETVAVTVNPDDDLLARIRDAMHPDWIQLHGSEPPHQGKREGSSAGLRDGVATARSLSRSCTR